jgi:hypothetical protein
MSLEGGASHAGEEKEFDVLFAAGASGESGRWDILHQVAALAPEIKIRRIGADKTRVFGSAYLELLDRTRFGLNWSKVNDVQYYSSDRIAQLFGRGVCVCIPESSGYRDFLGDDEAVFFRDAPDLASKLRSALAQDNWRDIARRGQERYRNLFDEVQVARYMQDVMANGGSAGHPWAEVTR